MRAPKPAPARRSPTRARHGPSRDPLPILPAAIAAAAAGDDLDATLAAILAAGVAALAPTAAAIFLSDPDRPGLSSPRRTGMEDGAHSSPMRRTRTTRSPRPRPAGRGVRSGGHGGVRRAFVGAYLPLVVASGGVEAVLGSIGMVWPAPHAARRRGPRGAGRAGGPRGAGRRPGSAGIDGVGALRVVRADGPHRPAHRARQRADGRPGPRARARARRPAGQRALARDVRRRRLQGDERAGRPRGRRRRPAPGRGGAGRVGPAGRHRGADRRRRVRPGRAGLRRADGGATRARRDRGTPRGRRPDRVGVGRRRAVPGGRHRFGVVDRRGERGAGAGQGRGGRVGRRDARPSPRADMRTRLAGPRRSGVVVAAVLAVALIRSTIRIPCSCPGPRSGTRSRSESRPRRSSSISNFAPAIASSCWAARRSGCRPRSGRRCTSRDRYCTPMATA